MHKIENRTKNKENRLENRSVGEGFISTKYFYILFSIFFSLTANAQCAMCRAALSGESNIKKAEAVNDASGSANTLDIRKLHACEKQPHAAGDCR